MPPMSMAFMSSAFFEFNILTACVKISFPVRDTAPYCIFNILSKLLLVPLEVSHL